MQTGYLPPLNILTDKGTSVHRTCQFLSVITVIPDFDGLSGCIYAGQPVVHDGHGIAVSITEGLQKLGIVGAQIEGGQYFHLSVDKELVKLYNLPETFSCTTGPLHRCGTVDTHIRKWLVKLENNCRELRTTNFYLKPAKSWKLDE